MTINRWICLIAVVVLFASPVPADEIEKELEQGWQAIVKKDYDLAIAYFSQAIRRDPKEARAFYGRAVGFSWKKEYNKAVTDYSEAIRLAPNSPAYFCRGLAYKRMGQYQKAIGDYTESIRLDPNFASPRNNFAFLLATCPEKKVRDGKKAVELATKACELSKWKNGNHLATLAAAYAESDDFDSAVMWQKKATEASDLPKDDLKKQKQRLKLYEKRKPYREGK